MKQISKYQRDQQSFVFDEGIPTREEILLAGGSKRVASCVEQIGSQIQIARYQGINEVVYNFERDGDTSTEEVLAHDVADRFKEKNRKLKTRIAISHQQLTLTISW